ncbi:MAG: hypothetical protein IPL51_00870 [Candidatus Competibacteraceae bacterium]|nr:hypothetical protein [Candidatus Competibacteraceae bacterium]
MICAIEAEGRWLVLLETRSKTLFLATLMHELTIAGRNSYRVQSEELDKPSQLRKVNEIQHRVAACLRQILSGEDNESFQESIAAWVLEQQDSELQGLMSYAWSNAKNKTS